MRWTQAIVLFGLAALLTFQVENSSAATLRNAVVHITEDEPREIISDEDDSKDMGKGILEIRAREQVLKMRIDMRRQMSELEKIGADPKAVELAEKIKARLYSIRVAASYIADTFKNTQAGVKAKELVTQVEENMEKVRAKIEELKKKPAQPTGNGAFDEEVLFAVNPEEHVKREIASFRGYVRIIVKKVKKQGMARGIGGHIIARLVAYQNRLARIVNKSLGNEVSTLAKEATAEADVAIKVIREAMNKNKSWQIKPAVEDDTLEDADDTSLEKAKQKLEKIREAVKADVAKFEKSKLGPKANQVAKRVRQQLAAHRSNAKKIAAEFGQTEVGKSAKELAKEIKVAMEKIRKSVPKVGPTTVKPQQDEDDEEPLTTIMM